MSGQDQTRKMYEDVDVGWVAICHYILLKMMNDFKWVSTSVPNSQVTTCKIMLSTMECLEPLLAWGGAKMCHLILVIKSIILKRILKNYVIPNEYHRGKKKT
jgi:hypothetical protein